MEKIINTSAVLWDLEKYIDSEANDLIEHEQFEDYQKINGMKILLNRVRWLLEDGYEGRNVTSGITNGVIVARLIKNEEEINLLKGLGATDTDSIKLCGLKTVRSELSSILVDDCGMQDEAVDAIIEGVQLKGGKEW